MGERKAVDRRAERRAERMLWHQYLTNIAHRFHYRTFHVGHRHRLVQEHVYPVLRNRNYYWTHNGLRHRRMDVFSNSHVRRANGYPVVRSNGPYWRSENGRLHYRKFLVGHYHRSVQEHVYPVVFKNGIYYATNNGFDYRKVFFFQKAVFIGG